MSETQSSQGSEGQGRSSKSSRSKRRAQAVQKQLAGARDLAQSVIVGTQATLQAAAMQSSGEAAQSGDQAKEAVSGLATSAGAATRQLIEAAARSVGATGGGIKGAASGVAQGLSIAGDALSTATRTAVGDLSSAADLAAQGDLDNAARQAAESITNVSLNAAMGAIGASATVVGAIMGGVQGAGAGVLDSSLDVTDVAAQATRGVIRNAAKGAEVVTDLVSSAIKAGGKRARKSLAPTDVE